MSTHSHLLLFLQRVPDFGPPGERQHGHRDPGTTSGREERGHPGKRNGKGGAVMTGLWEEKRCSNYLNSLP
jgi:hypothetical protein